MFIHHLLWILKESNQRQINLSIRLYFYAFVFTNVQHNFVIKTMQLSFINTKHLENIRIWQKFENKNQSVNWNFNQTIKCQSSSSICRLALSFFLYSKNSSFSWFSLWYFPNFEGINIKYIISLPKNEVPQVSRTPKKYFFINRLKKF